MGLLGLYVVGGLPGRAAAVGVVDISHDAAVAGGVTTGDAPGFPVTIATSGSYRLTSNLTGAAGVVVISITAHDVRLDLNGFALVGGKSGVYASASRSTTVVNGTVRGMEAAGIELGDDGYVERVHVTGNRSVGILAGGSSTVIGCMATSNRGHGIQVGNNSKVSGNMARNNGSDMYGIRTGTGCTVLGNTSMSNTSGIFAGAGSAVLGNTARANSDVGLFLESGAGYGYNVVTGNGNAQVSGGTDLGHNLAQ